MTSEWPALPLSHRPGDGPRPLLSLLTPSFLANFLLKFTLLANSLLVPEVETVPLLAPEVATVSLLDPEVETVSLFDHDPGASTPVANPGPGCGLLCSVGRILKNLSEPLVPEVVTASLFSPEVAVVSLLVPEQTWEARIGSIP